MRESRATYDVDGAPSSRFSGERCQHRAGTLASQPGPARTGPQILTHLLPGDQLDLVELNEQFVAHLQKRLASDPDFMPSQAQVRVLCMPIERVEGIGVYDFIVSGLPLNNFAPETVRKIMRAFKRLLKPSGVLSYFEYDIFRHLKSTIWPRSERHRVSRVARIVGKYIRKYQLRQGTCFERPPPSCITFEIQAGQIRGQVNYSGECSKAWIALRNNWTCLFALTATRPTPGYCTRTSRWGSFFEFQFLEGIELGKWTTRGLLAAMLAIVCATPAFGQTKSRFPVQEQIDCLPA